MVSSLRKVSAFLFAVTLLHSSLYTNAQTANGNNAVESLTLQQCIDYAMQHQPALKQSMINVSITKTTNAINLSGWFPQATGTAEFTHYYQLPTIVINVPNGPEEIEKTGIVNTFTPALAVTQTIFNPSLVYAATSASLNVKQARLVIDSTKIGLVAYVSQAFYNLLLTLQQIDVLKQDTVLFARSYNDAYHQYVGGIVDETDYEQAAITLNNAKAQLRQASENVIPQYATLKQLMGYPPLNQFNVNYDTAQMMNDIAIDTTQQLQFEKRIEYQQLLTAKELQRKYINYNILNFLPTLGGFFDYNYEYENNTGKDLFATAYPNSLIGLSLNFPLFTGLSRIESVHRAKLQAQLLDWSEVGLKSEIYTEYATALANYRGNLYNMQELKENEMLAKRVYSVVALQYKQGIVPYLNVITAESNLVTSEIGYLNALFTVMSNKIDLEKAMGNISY